MSKTFLLGVGCQRGGTTWLYEMLAQHPDCAMSSPKELHIFDAAFLPDQFGHFLDARLASLRSLEDPSAVAALSELLDMTQDIRLYPRYFDRVLADRPEARLVGEITPSYSALTAEHFMKIRDLLESAGYRLKVVFLMRDPIDRAFSQMRLQDRNGRAAQIWRPWRPAHERFAETCGHPEIMLRSRFDRTLEALDRAFARDQIFLGFYETMFRPEEVERLLAFLDLPIGAFDLSQVTNSAPVETDLTVADRRAGRSVFNDVYEACATRFGREKITAIWPNSLLS